MYCGYLYQYIVDCIVQCTVYIVKCSLYTVPFTLYSENCTVCTVYSVECTVCTVSIIECRVCSAHKTMRELYSVYCTLYSESCTVCTTHCTVCNAHCTVSLVECAVHTTQCVSLWMECHTRDPFRAQRQNPRMWHLKTVQGGWKIMGHYLLCITPWQILGDVIYFAPDSPAVLPWLHSHIQEWRTSQPVISDNFKSNIVLSC